MDPAGKIRSQIVLVRSISAGLGSVNILKEQTSACFMRPRWRLRMPIMLVDMTAYRFG